MLYAYIFNYGKLLAKTTRADTQSQLLLLLLLLLRQPPAAVATGVQRATCNWNFQLATFPQAQLCDASRWPLSRCKCCAWAVALVIVYLPHTAQVVGEYSLQRAATVNCVAVSRELKLISCRHGA